MVVRSATGVPIGLPYSLSVDSLRISMDFFLGWMVGALLNLRPMQSLPLSADISNAFHHFSLHFRILTIFYLSF